MCLRFQMSLQSSDTWSLSQGAQVSHGFCTVWIQKRRAKGNRPWELIFHHLPGRWICRKMQRFNLKPSVSNHSYSLSGLRELFFSQFLFTMLLNSCETFPASSAPGGLLPGSEHAQNPWRARDGENKNKVAKLRQLRSKIWRLERFERKPGSQTCLKICSSASKSSGFRFFRLLWCRCLLGRSSAALLSTSHRPALWIPGQSFGKSVGTRDFVVLCCVFSCIFYIFDQLCRDL